MDQPEPDYPAAHSMDTTWYAVDRDGHVGLFDSWEAGAVPEGAHTEEQTSIEDLAEAAPPAPYRLMDWLGEGQPEHHVDLPPREPGGPGLGKVLLFLASVDPLREALEARKAQRADAAEGVAVLAYDLPVELAWQVHEAGRCLGCFAWSDDERGHDFRQDLPRRVGLFRFAHDAENWISGPYVPRYPRRPDRPIRLDDLPAGLREAIGRVRFADLSFAEAEGIQPVPGFACHSWESAYLDLDRVTVRPIPGREEEFDPEEWARIPGLRVEFPGQGQDPLPADPAG